MRLAETPEITNVHIRTEPKTSTEIPRVLDQLVARGVNPAEATFDTPDGKILKFDELPQTVPRSG